MPFSISGRIAQGADEALEQVLDRRLKEAVRQDQERQRVAENLMRQQGIDLQREGVGLQRETLAGAQKDRDIDNARQQQLVDLQLRKDTAAEAEKATERNRASDAAAVFQMPGMPIDAKLNELRSSALRAGGDPLKVIENLIPKRTPMHYVTTPGPHGPVVKGFAEDSEELKQGVPQYVAPEKAPKVDLTPGQKFQATRALRNDYVRETGAAKTISQQLAQMRSSMQAVNDGKAAAGSQGVLVTFQKILDPTSVVRESEYARSASGQSLLNAISGQWDRIQAGGVGVTKEELQKFVDLAERFTANSVKSAKETRKQIDAIAKEFELNPDNITRDYDEDAAGADPATDPAKTTTTNPPGGGGRVGYGDLFPKPPG